MVSKLSVSKKHIIIIYSFAPVDRRIINCIEERTASRVFNLTENSSFFNRTKVKFLSFLFSLCCSLKRVVLVKNPVEDLFEHFYIKILRSIPESEFLSVPVLDKIKDTFLRTLNIAQYEQWLSRCFSVSNIDYLRKEVANAGISVIIERHQRGLVFFPGVWSGKEYWDELFSFLGLKKNEITEFALDSNEHKIFKLLLSYLVFPGTLLRDLLNVPFIDESLGKWEKEMVLLKYSDFLDEYSKNRVADIKIGINSPLPNIIRYNVIKHRFWYVDIPRTSSSSIKAELARNFGPAFGKGRILEKKENSIHLFPNHVPAKIMREMMGSAIWNNSFKFSIVRNPWDRMVSMYFYRRKVGNIPPSMSFRDYILALQRSVGKGLFAYHGFYFSNADYLCDPQGNLLVDYVGRFEQRREALQNVGEIINCQFNLDNHLQTASVEGLHYSFYYDEQTRAIIETLYARDLAFFGYSFEMM